MGERGRLSYKVNRFLRIANAAAAANGGSGLKWIGKNVGWVPDTGPGFYCSFGPDPRLLMAYCAFSGSETPARTQMVCCRFLQKQGMWGSGTRLRRRSPGGGYNPVAPKMKQGVPKNLW